MSPDCFGSWTTENRNPFSTATDPGTYDGARSTVQGERLDSPKGWTCEEVMFRHHMAALQNVDARMIRGRREDAGTRRRCRQDRQRQLIGGLHQGDIQGERGSVASDPPQNHQQGTATYGVTCARPMRVRRVKSSGDSTRGTRPTRTQRAQRRAERSMWNSSRTN